MRFQNTFAHRFWIRQTPSGLFLAPPDAPAPSAVGGVGCAPTVDARGTPASLCRINNSG